MLFNPTFQILFTEDDFSYTETSSMELKLNYQKIVNVARVHNISKDTTNQFCITTN